jgi:hypothetical protein
MDARGHRFNSVRNFRSRLDAYNPGGGKALLQRPNGIIPRRDLSEGIDTAARSIEVVWP